MVGGASIPWRYIANQMFGMPSLAVGRPCPALRRATLAPDAPERLHQRAAWPTKSRFLLHRERPLWYIKLSELLRRFSAGEEVDGSWRLSDVSFPTS